MREQRIGAALREATDTLDANIGALAAVSEAFEVNFGDRHEK